MRTLSLLLLAAVATAEDPDPRLAADVEAFRAWVGKPVTLEGRVVDEDGKPVDATVEIHGWLPVVHSDAASGRFSLTLKRRVNGLLLVNAEGFYTEVRVAELEIAADSTNIGTIRLWKCKLDRARLVFGGDAMMGRRFLTGDDELHIPPLLREGHFTEDAWKILERVAPILRSGNGAILNLETVISAKEGTPASKKAYNIWSPPEFLDALKRAGVDGVTQGNNHTWDYGKAAYTEMQDALNLRHIRFCGSGSEELSLQEMYLQELDVLSFCGVEGEGVPFASGDHAGVARMLPETIEAQAKKHAPCVVALHSGLEYSDEPTQKVRDAEAAAVRGGASLVVGGHPHSPQGLELSGTTLIAHCLGNLVFDQKRWESVPGLILIVDLEGGRVTAARLIPIANDRFRPVPAAGPMARWTARHVGARSKGLDVFWSGGRIVAALAPAARKAAETKATVATGLPLRLDPAAFLTRAVAAAPLDAGRDLLRIGSFEDGDTDGESLDGDAWELSTYARISTVAPRTGAASLLLLGSASAELRLRMPVPGRFTIAGWSRAAKGQELRVECEFWKKGGKEPYRTRVAGKLASGTRDWTAFSFDVKRPKDAATMRLRFAGGDGDEGSVQLDDVAVIAWTPLAGPLPAPNDVDWLRAPGAKEDVPVTLTVETLADEER